MVHALIFAGGTGQRMNSKSKPKQFLELHGKPILIFTIEHFERHPDVDNIAIVCIAGWIEELKELLIRYNIKKVSLIVPGGDTGHESIYNGLQKLALNCDEKDIVLIHDGVRPLINSELISANLESVRKFGTSITVEPALESIVSSIDGKLIDDVPNRGSMYIAKAPQSFSFGLIWEAYQKAQEQGILTIDSAHLLSLYGYEMHTVRSSPYNLKITAPSDYYVFRALYEAMENSQIFGI